MEDYASGLNRKKDDAPEKKIEKIVSGNASKRKKGNAQKFTDIFISEDVNSVKSYILMDVIVPAVKKGIVDIITNGVDMLFYGESGSPNSSRKSSASKISYRNYYESNKERERNSRIQHSHISGYDYDDIVLESRGEAEEVLARMDELISTYGIVSVADLYDLVGVTCNYTDNKYGWTDIRLAKIVRSPRDGGYLIKMPRAMQIDY